MQESKQAGEVRLWSRDGFIEDRWQRVGDDGALPGSGNALLSLAGFLDHVESVGEAAFDQTRIGVELLPGEAIDPLLPHLSRLPLVALAFPAFSDGRSFSKAGLLRRHGFAGRLRATGEVLIDQLPHMLRLGFEEFEIANATTLARIEQGRLGGIPFHYQPTSPNDRKGAGYSWRRLPAA